MLCGWALALAHAKSGDAAMIAGYAGRSDALDAALATFAFAYAEQTERDYDALKKAAKEMVLPTARAPVICRTNGTRARSAGTLA
jgi:Uncharacterized protein conserved in bacteria (DUF2252)